MQPSLLFAITLCAPLVAILYHGYWRTMSSGSTAQSIDVADASAATPTITTPHPLLEGGGARRVRGETIVTGDLFLDGDDRFLLPLKVTGDLVIAGDVRFDGTVTVNGYVHVRKGAAAAFDGGLVAKADVLAEGRVTTGRGGRGWCIARNVTGLVAAGDDEMAVLKAA